MSNQTHLRLGRIAAGRHGVFTLAEARAVGIPDRTIARRARVGIYNRVQQGVYTITGTPPTWHQSVAVAVASFPALSAASHQTAAELWGLTNRGVRRVEVVTTRWDRVRRDGVKVHESLDLISADVVEVDGVPVTTPVRTVVDLGASNRWLVEGALEEGIRRRLFTLPEVTAFVARVGKRGRRGVGVIRPLLEARRRWDSVTESALEDKFRQVIADAEMPAPQAQFVLRDERGDFVCRADFAYPASRILIELDSEAHHLDRVSFRRDRAKQNRAAMLGWTILRYTWWDLVEEPVRVCREIEVMTESVPPEAVELTSRA